MNSGRRFSLAAAIFGATAMLMASDSIDYRKVNPPWRPGKYYSVKSRYEMRLDNIVLDVKQIRKAHKERHFWTLWLRETDHPEEVVEYYYSKPFSGMYSCYLNYQTFGAYIENRNAGSVFRRYANADVSFQPLDAAGRTAFIDAEPSWLRRVLFGPRSEEVSNREIAEKMQDADFVFREIFTADGKSLDSLSWYFLAWKQREAFRADMRYSMDVFKRDVRDVPNEFLMNLSPNDRAKISSQSVGTGAASCWSKESKLDLGFCVAQAEAKMMTYAIYGQQETRQVGDVWTVDSDMLESFFPLQSKNRKPFSFKSGVLVLTVVSDDNGVVTVKSLPRGKVDGSIVSTDLNIEPRTEESEHRPEFTTYMQNEHDNFVVFTIDTDNRVCTKAEMRATLCNYRGAVPKVEQLSLNDPEHEMRVHIDGGAVVLHSVITTDVEDK